MPTIKKELHFETVHLSSHSVDATAPVGSNSHLPVSGWSQANANPVRRCKIAVGAAPYLSSRAPNNPRKSTQSPRPSMPLDPATHPAREAKNKSLRCSVVFVPLFRRCTNAHVVQYVHYLVAGRVSHSCLNTRKFLLQKEPRAGLLYGSLSQVTEFRLWNCGVYGNTITGR